MYVLPSAKPLIQIAPNLMMLRMLVINVCQVFLLGLIPQSPPILLYARQPLLLTAVLKTVTHAKMLIIALYARLVLTLLLILPAQLTLIRINVSRLLFRIVIWEILVSALIVMKDIISHLTLVPRELKSS